MVTSEKYREFIGKRYKMVDYYICKEKVLEFIENIAEVNDKLRKKWIDKPIEELENLPIPKSYIFVILNKSLKLFYNDESLKLNLSKLVLGGISFKWFKDFFVNQNLNINLVIQHIKRIEDKLRKYWFFILLAIITDNNGEKICQVKLEFYHLGEVLGFEK